MLCARAADQQCVTVDCLEVPECIRDLMYLVSTSVFNVAIGLKYTEQLNSGSGESPPKRVAREHQHRKGLFPYYSLFLSGL